MSEYAHRSTDMPMGVDSIPRRWPWSIVLSFGIALGGTLAVAMLQGEKPFWTDAGGYWGLGETFTVNGHFSLLNFSHQTKGYTLPLIYHGLQALATDWQWTSSSIAKIFNVLLFASIGTVLGPALVRVVWPSQPVWGVWRRLLVTALLVVFWSGFLNVPFSDFPALAVALVTLIAVARVDSPGWMLLAGAALALTINIRESYVPLAPFVVAIIVWTWFEQRGTPHASTVRRALCAGLFIVGFAVVSLPQSLSAHRYYHSWSFIPGATNPEPAGVFYSLGFNIQAYNTYIINNEARVEMKYIYPAGERLLKEQPEGKITSTNQYVNLFFSHPLVMGGMLVRHVVNGLDPLYSTPFVQKVHNLGRTWGRVTGFLLLFIALLRVLWPAARRRLGPGRLRYLVAMLIACVSTVPIGWEIRYLVPVYLLAYLLALTPNWPNPIDTAAAGLRRFRAPVVIGLAFVVYAAFVWYITSDAISHLVIQDGITHEILHPQ
jgi:hypothetical protein